MITSNEIQTALQWRYATKAYDKQKKISAEQWGMLKNALQLAPSSYGLQPWKFMIIQNPSLRSELRKVSWDQAIVEDCSHYVVFCTLKEMSAEHIQKHIQRTAQVRNIDPSQLEGYKQFMMKKLLEEKSKSEHLEWNRRQAYIAMGFLLETAALIQVDATPIEGLEPAKYDEILKLNKTPYASVAAVALGFRSPEDKYQQMAKSRFALDEVIQVID